MATLPSYEIMATYKALISSPYMALVIVDKQGMITLMNDTFLESLELNREDVIGKHVLEILPHSKLPEILATGRVDKADIWPINGKDTIVTRIPIIKGGEIIGAIGQSLALDMSGAKIFMKRLEENQRDFDTFIEGLIESPYLIYVIINRDGIITAINQTYLDILEMKHEDVIGRHIHDITPNSELPDIIRTGRVDKAAFWPIRGHDTIVTRLPIKRDGKIVGAIGQSLFMDRSGAQALMEKMRETEQEFATTLEGLIESPYMVYVIVDKDGYITAMNQTYIDILGFTKEEVIGAHILDISPTSELPEILATGRVDKADIFMIKGRETIVTRLPIIKDGQIIGAIGKSLFLDMSGVRILTNKIQETEKELSLYKEEVRSFYRARWQFPNLIGQSPEFLAVKSFAEYVSQTGSTLLITGESGTGKELFAQAIHNASSRGCNPFIRINCAALPDNLLESELFGYEDGAFTGARKGGKPGKFELARGGTIFLDEVGDMPLAMQTKLLAVLQERSLERVGGTALIPVDVRVIAATNRNLEEMVRESIFRQDLYYRLNVVRLTIPPLRERRADIPLLTRYIIGVLNHDLRTAVKGTTDSAGQLLQEYDWPGNVRELYNLLEQAINLATMEGEKHLATSHFPSLVKRLTPAGESVPGNNLAETVENIEKRMIEEALKSNAGNRSRTAKQLGMHSSALYRKLSKYGLS